MSVQRLERVNELLQREIASGLYRVQTDPPLDLARVTISHVMCSPDLRKARVNITVLKDTPEAPTAAHVVRVLNKHRKEFQALVAEKVILKFTPHLQFCGDDSLDGASRVLRILDTLPIPPEAPPHGPSKS